MSKSTPGPWRVHCDDRQRVCDRDPVKQIARTYVGSGVREREEAEANAHLIAAAPELLAAVRSVVEWFDSLDKEQYERTVLGQTLETAAANWELPSEVPSLDMAPLQAALAKAEGR